MNTTIQRTVTRPRPIQPVAVGDIVEVIHPTDTASFRLRVFVVFALTNFPVVTGHVIDQRGRSTDTLTFPLTAGIPYAVVPPRPGRWLREVLFGRQGRHRRTR